MFSFLSPSWKKAKILERITYIQKRNDMYCYHIQYVQILHTLFFNIVFVLCYLPQLIILIRNNYYLFILTRNNIISFERTDISKKQ